MARTITVKGTGNASSKPDYVVLSILLESQNMKYDKAMEGASLRIQQLTETLESIGFEKSDLKTTNFNVQTDYSNEKDRNGNYHRVFEGYKVIQNLKLAFDFDTQRLAAALSAISGCVSNPELTIRFTVKDMSLRVYGRGKCRNTICISKDKSGYCNRSRTMYRRYKYAFCRVPS